MWCGRCLPLKERTCMYRRNKRALRIKNQKKGMSLNLIKGSIAKHKLVLGIATSCKSSPLAYICGTTSTWFFKYIYLYPLVVPKEHVIHHPSNPCLIIPLMKKCISQFYDRSFFTFLCLAKSILSFKFSYKNLFFFLNILLLRPKNRMVPNLWKLSVRFEY